MRRRASRMQAIVESEGISGGMVFAPQHPCPPESRNSRSATTFPLYTRGFGTGGARKKVFSFSDIATASRSPLQYILQTPLRCVNAAFAIDCVGAMRSASKGRRGQSGFHPLRRENWGRPRWELRGKIFPFFPFPGGKGWELGERLRASEDFLGRRGMMDGRTTGKVSLACARGILCATGAVNLLLEIRCVRSSRLPPAADRENCPLKIRACRGGTP